MEQQIHALDTEMLHPLLLLPKKCTTFETICGETDMLVNVNIKIVSSDGNEMCIYSGFCNVKLQDSYDANIKQNQSRSSPDTTDIDQIQVVKGNNQSLYPYSQSQVWIDPGCSPYVYNGYIASESPEKYSAYHQAHSSHITPEQKATNVTQNVNEFDHEKIRNVQADDTNPQNSSGDLNNPYGDDEFECGEFFSQLSEENINEKEPSAWEEMYNNGLQSENVALKQQISSDTQSNPKQQMTILFLGQDSHFGQTIHKISVHPSLECVAADEMNQELVVDNINNTRTTTKIYQCYKCKQMFDQLVAFKKHMVGTEAFCSEGEVKFMCNKCDKSLKTREKFELHCFSHGDPELKCNKCDKVFASKFTMRTHQKIHNRKHQCDYCTKTFTTEDKLRTHVVKIHFIHACDKCHFTTEKYEDLMLHNIIHEDTHDTKDRSLLDRGITADEIREADSIISQVLSNEIFLLHAKKAANLKRYKKFCGTCSKFFDRVGYLKRHLIEHVVRSTLAKNPVNKNGLLEIECPVCKTETFSKVEKYKAHLRVHAKLTLYECTICNKSFSDSSNFSKHKKIHGEIYFQCDFCQRKFINKKRIAQHMVYHNNNSFIPCSYCNKSFHFKSMLNKHIKGKHSKETSRYRCRICCQYFKTLKEKWDHEWTIHKTRKAIHDCIICGSKFRKYSELKRHCNNNHNLEILSAKMLLNKDNV